jgi:hypothetical protein
MDDHGIWTNPQEDEIGRFLNIDGERFVLYKDRTFASDENAFQSKAQASEKKASSSPDGSELRSKGSCCRLSGEPPSLG